MSRKNKALSIFVLSLSASCSVLSALFLYFIASSFDNIQNDTFKVEELVWAGGIILAVLTVSIIHILVQQQLYKAYSVDLKMKYIENNFSRYYLQKNPRFIEGEISIIINDIDALTECFSKKLNLIEQIMAMLVYFTLLVITNWILGITLFVLSIAGGLSILISGKRYIPLRGAYFDSIEEYETYQKEFITSGNLMHYTDTLLDKAEDKCNRMCDCLLDYGLYRAKIVSLSGIISNVSMIILFIILAVVYYEEEKLSLVFLSFEYFEITLFSIKDIIISINDIISTKGIRNKVFAIPRYTKRGEYIHTFNVLEISHFKTDYLSYEINLIVKRGEKLLLSGKNGIGKTTLLNGLLNRLEYQGRCLIDNLDIQDYASDSLFSYMPQNPVILDTDFYNNVTVYGALNYDEATVNHILKIVDMDYLKGNQALKDASQGEKEVILFIRTILDDNMILLLDEPFDSLAIELKERLIEYLSEAKEKTILIVEHSHFNLYKDKGFRLVSL